MHPRPLLRAALLATTASVALACTEVITRRIDGYSIASLRLIRPTSVKVPIDAVAASYVAQVPVAPGVSRSWLGEDPPMASGGDQSPDSDLMERARLHQRFALASVYQWNLEYLRTVACGNNQDLYKSVFAPVGDLFVFEPPGGTDYPRFRFLRSAHYPSGLLTNSFGWRGPDVPLHKPDRTIRIAFVGASTTVGAHAAKYSYPDYIRRWFELWSKASDSPARFEVINAGREGIDSSSIAAIVRDELAPMDPDIVVYYEGANQLWPSDFIQWPGGMVPRRPAALTRRPWAVESVSALAARVHTMWDRSAARTVEPQKPTLPVAWPAILQETNPRLDHPELPENLRTIIHDFDVMRATLAPHGGRLALSSFVWCVRDGMQLDPAESAELYKYLNESFWPFSYAHIRRMADFQNRVFATYARAHSLDFIDVAARYPIDPRLFSDAVHMTGPGAKLMAWISFQQLVPVLTRLIAAGEIPGPPRTQLSQHPAFTGAPRAMMPISSIRASCSAQ